MGWFGKKKATAEKIFDEKLAQYVSERVDAMGAYVCTVCGEEHVALDVAFQWPDVAVRTKAATDDEPEDKVVLGTRTYVRGTLRIPIIGEQRDVAVGIWAEIVDGSAGRLANQLAVRAPLLGEAVRVVPGAPGLRPTFELVNHEHPLAAAQREGVTRAEADAWRSAEAHRGDPEPRSTPFTASLEAHGWELLDSDRTSKPACTDPIAEGDYAKVVVRLVTTGESGGVEPFVAGWWIAVDHVDDKYVSGTLHSHPQVPATIFNGSRVWARRGEVFARQRE
jgi:hypothetical protein